MACGCAKQRTQGLTQPAAEPSGADVIYEVSGGIHNAEPQVFDPRLDPDAAREARRYATSIGARVVAKVVPAPA